MNWLRLHRRSALLVGLTLLVPIIIYLRVLVGVLGLALEYQTEQDRVDPRAARLQGLLAQESRLEELRDEARARLSTLVYPPTEDAQTLAATLQANTRQILSDAGMAVSNSQVLRTREGEAFDRIAVKVTVNGSLHALDSALSSLAAQRPRLLLESLDVFPARAGRGNGDDAQQLGAVIQVLALRAVG